MELLDKPVYEMGHLLSGHTLKHLLAAISAWWILRILQKRKPLAQAR